MLPETRILGPSNVTSQLEAGARGGSGTHIFRERRDHDGFATVASPAGQSLPEIFGDEWHEGMQELETSVQASVERVLSGHFGLGIYIRLKGRLGGLDVDIAEVVEEEVVGCVGGDAEVASLQVGVDDVRGEVELV